MIASFLSKSEKEKEIRRLKRNLNERIKGIEMREDLPQTGAESFRNFERRLENKLNGQPLSSLSEKDISTIYRDIKYLDNLRSTHLHGAEKMRDYHLPFRDRLDKLSPDTQKKFFDIYDKFVSQTGISERYKYELEESVLDLVYDGLDEESALQRLFEKYDEIQEQSRGEWDERKTIKLFLDSLD